MEDAVESKGEEKVDGGRTTDCVVCKEPCDPEEDLECDLIVTPEDGPRVVAPRMIHAKGCAETLVSRFVPASEWVEIEYESGVTETIRRRKADG